jgi:hypothetical protein
MINCTGEVRDVLCRQIRVRRYRTIQQSDNYLRSSRCQLHQGRKIDQRKMLATMTP